MNILLLQGPLGPFFRHLARELQSRSHTLHRIHLNGGDRFYSGIGHCVDYCGTSEEWPDFISLYLQQHSIDMLIVFGDCRHYHKPAIAIARQLSIRCIVLEEGYLRPDWITCEDNGTNANSSFLQHMQLDQVITDKAVATNSDLTGNTLIQRFFHVNFYYWPMWLAQRRFPHYIHHVATSPPLHAFRWSLGFVRKALYYFRDKRSLKQTLQHNTPFFLFPLQVSSDAQILFHSDFHSIEEVIHHAVRSFAEHAPASHRLMVKHHPQDRGYNHYGRLLQQLAQQYNLGERLCYGHDWHLPTLLRHCQGVVTLNSTVGISALIHHRPVKVLGRAFWNLDGITDQQPLATFWQQPAQPDAGKTDRLLTAIKHHTQLRGSFYKHWHQLAKQVADKLSSPASG